MPNCSDYSYLSEFSKTVISILHVKKIKLKKRMSNLLNIISTTFDRANHYIFLLIKNINFPISKIKENEQENRYIGKQIKTNILKCNRF